MRTWPIYVGFGTGLVLCILGLVLQSAKPESNLNFVSSVPRHPVTEKMLADAAQREKKVAPTFTLTDAAGKPFNSQDFVPKMPVVVISVLTDCPCSMESQPVWNAMATMYAGRSQFFGISKDTPEHIKKYTTDFNVSFPILVDADRKVLNGFGMPASVYIALIGQDGKVYKMWPGYSKKMVREMNDLLAKLSGLVAIDIDLSAVPENLSSGCSLDGS